MGHLVHIRLYECEPVANQQWSYNEASVWCSTAGRTNMHKEFTMTFAEASQYEVRKDRQEEQQDTEDRMAAEMEN